MESTYFGIRPDGSLPNAAGEQSGGANESDEWEYEYDETETEVSFPM
jgi:hypothetical protein